MADDKPTDSKSIDERKDYINMCLVGVAVILLLVYARIVQNRKHWIYLECAVAGLYAAASTLLGGRVGETSSIAVYFIRLRAAAFVSHAMATYFTEHTSDKTVPIAVSISNLLSKGIVCWEAAIVFLLALGDLYHVLASKTRIYSHRTVGDPISFHVSIDAIVSFCFGIFVLGFPDVLLKAITSNSANDTHLIIVQLWGITLLSGALLSFASLCYRNDEDALGTLKAKLIVYLTAEVLAITHLIVDSSFRTYWHCGIMVGLMGGLAWNAGHVVYQHEKYE